MNADAIRAAVGLDRRIVYLLEWAPAPIRYVGRTNGDRLARRVAAHRRGHLLRAVFAVNGEPRIEILHDCRLGAETIVLEAWEIARLAPTRNQTPGCETRRVADLLAWRNNEAEFQCMTKPARAAWAWLVGLGPGPGGAARPEIGKLRPRLRRPPKTLAGYLRSAGLRCECGAVCEDGICRTCA